MVNIVLMVMMVVIEKMIVMLSEDNEDFNDSKAGEE